MVDPFSEETEVGVFVHSFGGMGKDVITELLVTRNGTLVPTLQMAELSLFDSTNTNPNCY
jgi:hypothetical protein